MTGLAELVRVSNQVAATSSRLAKIRELADFLRPLEREEIEIALPYLSGDLRQGKLAVGYAALQSARASAASAPGLSLQDVDRAFQQLKQVKGKGAAEQRSALLRELLQRATAEEQDFLVRLMVGELRQGALEGIMVEAVAAAAALPAADVRRAVAFAGAIAPVASAALSGGASALAQFSVQLMQPVLPMLAQPAEDMRAALAALGTALVEWKLDGARVQVHKSADDVRVYTRNLNDVTARVPEIVAAARGTAAQSLILDGEAIALRPNGRPHPFPVTMSRFGSQQEAAARRSELPLSVFFFDCLYVDGATLFDHPTREPRDRAAPGETALARARRGRSGRRPASTCAPSVPCRSASGPRPGRVTRPPSSPASAPTGGPSGRRPRRGRCAPRPKRRRSRSREGSRRKVPS